MTPGQWWQQWRGGRESGCNGGGVGPVAVRNLGAMVGPTVEIARMLEATASPAAAAVESQQAFAVPGRRPPDIRSNCRVLPDANATAVGAAGPTNVSKNGAEVPSLLVSIAAISSHNEDGGCACTDNAIEMYSFQCFQIFLQN